jgi:hypothetical protein
VTNFEKTIYNAFLVASRKSQSQPFRIRQNFNGFENKTDYIHVKRLTILFSKFPDISFDNYFMAPYVLYPDQKYFDLSFYASQKGVKCYSLYIKQIKLQSPNTKEQLEFIKKSLKFIGVFCLQNKIKLDQYLTFKKSNSYCWLNHIAKGQISIYSLFEFQNLYDIISSLPQDELELFLGDICKNYSNLRTQYNNSKEAKYLVQEGIKRIKKYVESQSVILYNSSINKQQGELT